MAVNDNEVNYTPISREAFLASCANAAKQISRWPRWKQEMMTGTYTEPEPTEDELELRQLRILDRLMRDFFTNINGNPRTFLASENNIAKLRELLWEGVYDDFNTKYVDMLDTEDGKQVAVGMKVKFMSMDGAEMCEGRISSINYDTGVIMIAEGVSRWVRMANEVTCVDKE